MFVNYLKQMREVSSMNNPLKIILYLHCCFEYNICTDGEENELSNHDFILEIISLL